MSERDWEEIARLDPHWMMTGDRRGQFWTMDDGDLFMTGEHEVGSTLSYAAQLGFLRRYENALDFGCGLGRHTRALSTRFSFCQGLDASKTMVAKARELNRTFPNCKFLVTSERSLSSFDDDTFDLVWSFGVFQCYSDTDVLMSCIKDCFRVLRPSGLFLFQMPDHMPELIANGRLRVIKRSLKRLGLRRRHLYWGLRRLGFDRIILYKRLGLWPEHEPHCVPQTQIANALIASAATILDVQVRPIAGLPDADRIFWVTKTLE
jgi:SAM-dependent methyltransferase